MEKRGLAAWDWVILGTIGCFAFLVVVYVIFGIQFFGRVLRSESAAAWVQAFGSIAAIAAAVVLARRDSMERKRLAIIDAFVVASRIRASVRSAMQSTSWLISTFDTPSRTIDEYHAKACLLRDRIDAMPAIPAADVAALARASGSTAANLGAGLDLIAILRTRFVATANVKPTQIPMAYTATVRRELAEAYDRLQLASAQIDSIVKNPPPP